MTAIEKRYETRHHIDQALHKAQRLGQFAKEVESVLLEARGAFQEVAFRPYRKKGPKAKAVKKAA